MELNRRQSNIAFAVGAVVLLIAVVNSVLPWLFGWANPLFLPQWLTVCVNIGAFAIAAIVAAVVLSLLIGWMDHVSREPQFIARIDELIPVEAEFPGDVLLAPNLEESARASAVSQLMQLRRDPQVEGLYLVVDREDGAKVCDRVFLAAQAPRSAVERWATGLRCEHGRVLKKSGETLRRRFHLKAVPVWEFVWD